MIGVLQFNTKSSRDKVYNHLRACSILSEKSTKSRGDHHLRVHIPTNRTWPGIVQALQAQGFTFLNYGAE